MGGCGLGPTWQVSVAPKEKEDKYTENNNSLQMAVLIEKTTLHL